MHRPERGPTHIIIHAYIMHIYKYTNNDPRCTSQRGKTIYEITIKK